MGPFALKYRNRHGLRAPFSPRLTSVDCRQSNEIYSKSELRRRYHTKARGNDTVLLCDGMDPVLFGHGQHETLPTIGRTDRSVKAT